MTVLQAEGIWATFDESVGRLSAFTVADEGREITPLHRAPWVGTGEAMPPDAAPHMAGLAGDFFCAPFGQEDGASGLHGHPANSAWHVEREDGAMLEARLVQSIRGATITKTLSLRDGQPFVYQSHRFEGGEGDLPVANHAMVAVGQGGLIRTSAKTGWETPGTPLETDPARGRCGLLYPARSADPTQFPGIDGPVDLTRYPWGKRQEDFVVGIEAPGHSLGWTAVTRPETGDLFLSLRDPDALPTTMLWHSNGGRDYAPWSGRHTGCLGVEEGAAAQMVSPDTTLRGPGTLSLGRTVTIRHVIGAIAWPTGDPVAGIEYGTNTLVVTGESGASRSIPFDPDFLEAP